MALPDGSRQTVKTIVDLAIGDYVLIQQNVAIEKMEPEEAQTLLQEIEVISHRKGVE